MEGPYRDLGAGFARLTGVEGARRGLSRITHVEDALLELARNARDAGASRIYVASILKEKRFRTLTVIDDGHGLPESHRDLILQPGVTTRHLDPVTYPGDPATHGAGLSLYQIQNNSLQTRVLSSILAYLHTGHLRYRSPPLNEPSNQPPDPPRATSAPPWNALPQSATPKAKGSTPTMEHQPVSSPPSYITA